MKIKALVAFGLLITAMWSFFATHAETEAPVLRAGDQWNFQVTYGGRDVVEQYTVIVDRLEDFEGVPCYVWIYDTPEENGSVWMTSDWALLKADYLRKDDGKRTIDTYSPGVKFYDFPLSVGKEWSWESTITFVVMDSDGEIVDTWSGSVYWVRKVVSTYSITVPAGTFDTYLVGLYNEEGELMRRFWFSVDAKHHVKMEVYDDEGQWIYRQVLTSYELVSQGNGFPALPFVIAVAAIIGVLGFTIFLYYRRHRGTRNTVPKAPTKSSGSYVVSGILRRFFSIRLFELQGCYQFSAAPFARLTLILE